MEDLAQFLGGSPVIEALMIGISMLVGGWAYPSEKYEFVSWDDSFPIWWEKYEIHVPNHQPEWNIYMKYQWNKYQWDSMASTCYRKIRRGLQLPRFLENAVPRNPSVSKLP